MDGFKENFNNLKREIQKIEASETSAKDQVEEAMKKKNHYDDFCKKIRKKIIDNRDAFKK